MRKRRRNKLLGPSASLCSQRARRGGAGALVGSVRSKGRDRPARTRARRRGGLGPLTPAPSHASAPLPPARTLVSPGDMQMRYPRGGGPGRGVGRGRRGGSGLRAPGAHPATPAPELAAARAPTSRPAESARARARRPLSWRPSQSTARRSSLAAAPAGPAPCAHGRQARFCTRAGGGRGSELPCRRPWS